jgi:hypothetical protein
MNPRPTVIPNIMKRKLLIVTAPHRGSHTARNIMIHPYAVGLMRSLRVFVTALSDFERVAAAKNSVEI